MPPMASSALHDCVAHCLPAGHEGLFPGSGHRMPLLILFVGLTLIWVCPVTVLYFGPELRFWVFGMVSSVLYAALLLAAQQLF